VFQADLTLLFRFFDFNRALYYLVFQSFDVHNEYFPRNPSCTLNFISTFLASCEENGMSSRRGPQFVAIRMATVEKTSTKYILIMSVSENVLVESHLYVDRPARPAYGVYISQLIRYSRACGSYQDVLRKFYGRHHDLVSRHGISVSHGQKQNQNMTK
jgi:hypothetical protein